MSGRSCLVCVSLLCLLVALVGRSRCPVAPASCPGRLQFFRVCFSVTSRAELKGHRPENRQFSVRYLPAAVKPDGYFPASVVGKRGYVLGLRFALPRGVAASTSPDVAAAAIVSEETSRTRQIAVSFGCAVRRHTHSVVVSTRFSSATNHPRTFRPKCVKNRKRCLQCQRRWINMSASAVTIRRQ